jgi:uncharacterized membrane protein
VVFHRLKISNTARAAGAFAFTGLLLLIIYVPGPLDIIPVSEMLMATRLNLMVSPFVAFLMAFGIIYLLDHKTTIKNSPAKLSSMALPVCLVILTTFFSTISTGNAQDNINFPHTSTTDTPYFTSAELESFSFLNYRTDTTLPLYSDYQVCRDDYLLNNFATRFILTGGDLSYIRDGYLTLRIAELQRKKALTFSPDGYATVSYRYPIASFKTEMDTPVNLGSKNLVYSNGGVQIYLINGPDVSQELTQK